MKKYLDIKINDREIIETFIIQKSNVKISDAIVQ